MKRRPRQTARLTSAPALVGKQERGVSGGEEKRNQSDCGENEVELKAGDEEHYERWREYGEGYGAQGVWGGFVEDGEVDHNRRVLRGLIELDLD